MGPMVLYVGFYLYAGYRAHKETVGRAPGFLWQFKRETYSDLGWKWHKRARWIFAGFVPTAILLAQVARLACPDWGS